MKVIHWGRARRFFRLHPVAREPLRTWKAAVLSANWNHFPAVKQTFNTADWVDGKIVFDIKRNEYRLIAIASF